MKNATDKVKNIKDGSVLDHLPSEHVFRIGEVLGLGKDDNLVVIAANLHSRRMKSKGLIKVANIFFREEEINRIALIALEATLSIIRNYRVVEKRQVSPPQEVHGLVKCFNPTCITNYEQIPTYFHLRERVPISLCCHYCEKITQGKQIQLISDRE